MATKYVIIGGGPVATHAIETIRQLDGGGGPVTLVSDEPPHSRMALPYWLSRKITRQHTYTTDAQYLSRLAVDARLGVRARRIDPQSSTVELDDGSRLTFDRLLLATGSSPVPTPIPGADLPGVQPLWTLQQTEQVLAATEGLRKPRVVLVGAGFVGMILLSAMHQRGWQLTVVEQQAHILPRMLDPAAARLVEAWLAEQSVQVHTGTTVREIRPGEGAVKSVQLSSGDLIDADLVILGTGVKPNLQLTEGTGIAVDEGILIDDRMRTNLPNIYAGGDVAQGPVLFHERPAVHAIQPTAVDHGRVAGANMAGQQVSYPGSLLMNVVDVCGLQCVGFGQGNDLAPEATTIVNPVSFIYRKLLWRDDQMIGAILIGRAKDLGMLNDVGMIKGILQTQTRLGVWKPYLADNPFDIRRAYVACGVGQKLAETNLIGQAAWPRGYRFGDARPEPAVGPPHALLIGTRAT